jgi:putative transposase
MLKAERPFWGDRRIWAYLRCVEHVPVSKQRMWRVLREQPLLVPPNLRLRAKRTPTWSTPRPTKPHEWWGIDMTKVMRGGFGWLYLVVVLDWYTKQVVGDYAGVPCSAKHGLAALDMAVNHQFPDRARGKGWSLRRENGCQPTTVAFMEACNALEIHQAFTIDHNPRGHADTERCMRTLKEESRWW